VTSRDQGFSFREAEKREPGNEVVGHKHGRRDVMQTLHRYPLFHVPGLDWLAYS